MMKISVLIIIAHSKCKAVFIGGISDNVGGGKVKTTGGIRYYIYINIILYASIIYNGQW